uniref:Uncharacterized protein n=1 Tax=Anopheles culicifacies TaxID=139723 RepID=A0A182MAQ6_9DIPT
MRDFSLTDENIVSSWTAGKYGTTNDKRSGSNGSRDEGVAFDKEKLSPTGTITSSDKDFYLMIELMKAFSRRAGKQAYRSKTCPQCRVPCLMFHRIVPIDERLHSTDKAFGKDSPNASENPDSAVFWLIVGLFVFFCWNWRKTE